MNLDLSARQRSIQERTRDFVRREVMPVAALWDRQAAFPWSVHRAAHEAGLLNKYVPQAYGGQGYTLVEGCVANEEWGFGCTGISTGVTINDLGLLPLMLGASPEQKERFLAPIVREGLLASFCVTEPDTGSDVANLQTRAVRKGNAWVIRGRKKWITMAPHAHYFLVFAATDPDQGHKGLSCFCVPGDHAQIQRGAALAKMGQKAALASELEFQDVDVPQDHLIGRPGDGFKIIMGAFDFSRPSLSAQAVGLARRALEEARAYAAAREAFDQPIRHFQGVGFLLAEMDIRVEAARLLVFQAAWQKDQGVRNTRAAAICKTFGADAAMANATEAAQVLGGNGYSEDYPAAKLMRDAKIFQIYEGTTQIQKHIIAREMYR